MKTLTSPLTSVDLLWDTLGFLPVPGGSAPIGLEEKSLERFLKANSPDWHSYYSREAPFHQVTIAPFHLMRYAVTNGHYALFMAQDGYTNPDLWTPDGWAWLLRTKRTQPLHWNTPQFAGEDRPVVGVSWYEATAFARWASLQTGHNLRLPSEVEWEWAARGENTRSFYPWGGAWDAAKLNSGYSDETHPTIGTTTPVGMFSPAGDAPLGHGEMLGQVFEWMNSAFRPYPYDAHDGREDRYAPEMRVRRGGSWLDGKFAHRVTTRYYFPQHYSDKTDGFRLAAGGDALPLPPRPPYDLVVYGRTTFCPDLLHTIRWLHAWNVPYRQLQLDRDEEVALRLDAWLGARTIPTLVVAAWGDVLPITPPTGVDFSHLRNTDRGAMLHEPDESTLRAFLVRHGFLT
ncbi:MAG TPA: SUMF1/EgtB/PvdO family nonheme iron enzyme [Aggregatilineales bacterium]|nr:SUMF1/EgtB/PvdO family nonheme iron enzyme [Anaerolineales bacterium]HRE46118.1 SUMF1/EgtB/PvdO family nonheme iron enzyme [Aggregatilineales bacterium]